MHSADEPDYKRIFLAIFLAAMLLMCWQVFVEWPRRQALSQYNSQLVAKRKIEAEKQAVSLTSKTLEAEENSSLTREERIAASPRLAIASDTLRGSIALKGARFDDLILLKYLVDLKPNSPHVTLLSPNGDKDGYFAQIGWVAVDAKTKVPDQHSVWQSDKKSLAANETANLRWNNGEGVTYVLSISLDRNYMFTIIQRVENKTGYEISLAPYAYVNRVHDPASEVNVILHEGPMGVMNNTLNEVSYKDLREKGAKNYESNSGWFGMADHYWLTAFIPSHEHSKINFSYYDKNKQGRYQADYLGETQSVNDGQNADYTVRFFAGAKELNLLDHYANGNGSAPIPLFDRALDFGYFYFLAKPMCLTVDMLYDMTGNFGIALLIFIIIVKLCMYPLANKSYTSMSQMRVLQPEMVKIRERYVDDQIAMHKAMRDLYKREKVNPAAGCLPILIQILVFLALFRGLNVSIEMRHAPFFGWIKDLSAPDPSNLFTAFGLIDWPVPLWLHLGLLPIIYCVTMIIQTKQQPKPADPVQAKMMAWMPYFLLIFFDKMASGFVLYWTWSNILSIFQQQLITNRYNRKIEAKQKAA